MSLLTPTESVTARIAADAAALAAHLQNAVVLANRITGHALGLPTPALNDWLNARPLQQRLDEFASHADLGEAFNDAADLAEMATGRPEGSLGRVDVRPVAAKLEAQNRSLDIIDGAFVVTDLPPPEPGPERAE